MSDTLARKRNSIDAIDSEILELLKKRAETTKEIFRHKEKTGKPILDTQREDEILQHVRKEANGKFPQKALTSIFTEILSACRSLSKSPRIGLLGEKYGWVHDAAIQRLGSSSNFGCFETGEELLEALQRGDAGMGYVPMTTGSDLHLLIEAFMGGKIKIVAENQYLQKFALFSPDQKELPDINELYLTREIMTMLRQWVVSLSVPVPITICRSMVEVEENLVEGRQAAGLIPQNVAKTFEGHLIKEGLEPFAAGPIRCLTVAAQELPEFKPGNTASVLCHLSEDPESLPGVLAPLTWAGCPLKGIEIFRFHQKAWEELYLIDFQVPETERDYQKVLETMAPKCRLFRSLGQYPATKP